VRVEAEAAPGRLDERDELVGGGREDGRRLLVAVLGGGVDDAAERGDPNERNGPPLSVTIVRTGLTLPWSSTSARSRRGRPVSSAASVRASSTAAIASCMFAVGEMWNRCSYFDQ